MKQLFEMQLPISDCGCNENNDNWRLLRFFKLLAKYRERTFKVQSINIFIIVHFMIVNEVKIMLYGAIWVKCIIRFWCLNYVSCIN